MFAEYQGKRYEVDIVDGTVTAPMVKKGGLPAALLFAASGGISGGA